MISSSISGVVSLAVHRPPDHQLGRDLVAGQHRLGVGAAELADSRLSLRIRVVASLVHAAPDPTISLVGPRRGASRRYPPWSAASAPLMVAVG